MRQIVLDTETTGLETSQDHRIIEIGCVELVNRKLTGKHYHQYINPQRKVDEGAMQVHGITDEFLEDKPLFANIVDEFLAFVGDAELVIHNAPFDVGFINHELSKLTKYPKSIAGLCSIIDTLAVARNKHPGQRNNLDALCKRYTVDNSQRDLHGALLDAEILADVYLIMTGGQVNLNINDQLLIELIRHFYPDIIIEDEKLRAIQKMTLKKEAKKPKRYKTKSERIQDEFKKGLYG